MYKVIKNENGILSSVYSGKHSVQYVPNEWIGPALKGSKLYIFEQEKDAKSFRENQINLEVWECEVDEVLDFRASIFTDCIPFWNSYHSNDDKYQGAYKKHFPSSKMTNKVKLIRRIEYA